VIHYFKFRQDLFDPASGKEVYGAVLPGKGRPEECPPIRAANAFGFDLLANFDVTFSRKRDGTWRAEPDIVIDSDFDWSASPDTDGQPLTQQYAWFWQKGQKVPHVISDNVFESIKNQVKISTFLYLATDPNELLMISDPPLGDRPWRAMSALIDTDWYPASYPWHTVLELDPAAKKIEIAKGTPIARVVPVRRDTYFARQMSPTAFDEFFARSQKWISSHGREITDPAGGETPTKDAQGTRDITRTYSRQQVRSRFITMT
jgi:hypothetical protein